MSSVEISPAVRVELDRLVGLYGDDASRVGAIDGTEDDWGDLLGELAALVGIPQEQGPWNRMEDAASEKVGPGCTIEQLYLALLPLGSPA